MIDDEVRHWGAVVLNRVAVESLLAESPSSCRAWGVANPLCVPAQHADVAGSSLLLCSSPLPSARSFQSFSKLQFLQRAGRGRRVGARANPAAALSSCW